MSKLTLCLVILVVSVGQFNQSWHDQRIGEKRVKEIRARLKAATPCPWKSDGQVVGWWHNEQPGVAIRSAANFQCQEWNKQLKLCTMGTEGGPVAQVSSASWSGSRNPTADAEFIAHSCEDIQFLLDERQR